jgi:hypothetical protein
VDKFLTMVLVRLGGFLDGSDSVVDNSEEGREDML